jgi:hypothetical protein
MLTLTELCSKVIKGYQQCSYGSEYCGRCPYVGAPGDGSLCYMNLSVDARELQCRVLEMERAADTAV